MCSAPALEAQQSTITDTIDGQIAAFLAQDVERAFGFASPMIRGMFRTPEVFGQMVRQGYPMVWRPADVRYGTAESAGAVTRQTVIITDQAGAVHLLEYEMIPMEGGWLINGVRLLQAPQVGA
jgi:hypothetical protein